MEQSKKYALNKHDLMKIGKGFLVAMGGLALTYFAEAIGQIDFGDFTPVVVALAGVVVNVSRKFLAGQEL